MRVLAIAVCVGVAMAAAGSALADNPSPNGATGVEGRPTHRCPVGESYKRVCVKTVATPRPKNLPKNEPWLGEKCVKWAWKCVPPPPPIK